jgi:hypothetical protein
MPLWPWTQRTFTFDFPPEKWPDLVERVRGAPARAAARVGHLPDELLTRSDGRGWTIKQNLGHLIDLGYLPMTRIDQILRGESELVAADMSNAKTNAAAHNDRPIGELLAEFERERGGLVARLESLGEADWGRAGRHPRLKTPMRIVDIVYFDGEHDDYHLGRIGELIRSFS